MEQQPRRLRAPRARHRVHRRPGLGQLGGGGAEAAGTGGAGPGAPARPADAAAYRAALAALARRPYGTAELQATLLRKGHAAEAVRRALLRLQGLGYLDDRQYARLLAARAVGRQGAGPARLRQVLRSRGLLPDVVAAAVTEAFAETDERAAALAAGQRRLVALRGLPAEVARRRLAGHLSRRGHGPEAIAHALHALLGRGGDEPEEG